MVPRRPQLVPVLAPHDGAAAGGEDEGAGLEGAQDAGLVVAEGALAVEAEDLGDGATEAVDEERIGVGEVASGALGEESTDGGLAGAHHADQDPGALHA